MPSATTLRENVVAARARLTDGRERLRERHAQGAPGIQVCAALTDLVDAVLLEIFEQALLDLGETGPEGLVHQVALVPLAGYGRRDIAPFSDVDLMILHAPDAASRIAPLAERLTRDVFDVGLLLGHSVRTPEVARTLARRDMSTCTSLIEARYLAGSVRLFSQFARAFQRDLQGRRRLAASIEQARAEERRQYGETVYLLEPNVKRSRGGLRDLQLLRWLGFVGFGTSDPDGMRLRGALSRDDHRLYRRALEFLLRLRNEMHFRAGKAHDLLDRSEQMRLAEVLCFRGDDGLLPVEQFMREYFRITSAASDLATRLLAATRGGPTIWGRWLGPLFSHRFEGDFNVGPIHIAANRRGLAKLTGSLAEVLRMVEVASLYDKPVAFDTLEAVRRAVPELPDAVSPEASRRFLSLLGSVGLQDYWLRKLYELGVLEKLIPAFAHARSLLQFNEYHKFTVDEHCLRAVERAIGFQSDPGPLGRVYRRIQRKDILHLALLLHDLGKGYPQDHSEVGLAIADATARRLGLTEDDTEALKFLVHKHLTMAHLAFRRDTSDEHLLVRFAVEVGSADLLDMLFVLTAADLAAVGPGVLNPWKVDVLSALHRRTLRHLAPAADDVPQAAFRLRRAEEVLAALALDDDHAWCAEQLADLPEAYLRATPVPRILSDLRWLASLAPGQALADGGYSPETNTVEYRVATHESIAPGVFHRLAGALAGRGLRILSAEISTLPNGLVFDRFFVHDPDFAGEPPVERIQDVRAALLLALASPEGGKPVMRRTWQAGQERRALTLAPMPTRVKIDNATSERYTIIDVFAADRQGLLFTIGRGLFELGLSVSLAKIGTYLDQVVDVFYVTDLAGEKLTDEERMRAVRERLLADIARLEQQPSEITASG